MVYTLAAVSIAGVYFGVVAAVAELVRSRVPSSGLKGLVLAIVVTAVLFDPYANGFRSGWTSFSTGLVTTTAKR